MYEIKKKGRPVSQCERCRQLRNTKKVHSKCTCSEGSSSQTREVTDRVFGTKRQTFPDSLALTTSHTLFQRSVIFPSSRLYLMVSRTPSPLQIISRSPQLTHARKVCPVAGFLSVWYNPDLLHAVASLLNPCQCNDVWNCGCRTTASDAPHVNSEFAAQARALSPNGNNSASAQASDGLETLARAAAAVLFSSPLTPRNPPKQITSSSGTNEHACPSRSQRPSEIVTSPTSTPTPVLDLPPLLFPEVPGPTPIVPPFSTFNTLAGSGCTCGLTCQCPGCATHNSRPGVDSRNAQDCTTCVDPTLHVIDQNSGWGFYMESPVLERFFADAERVPPPPTAGGKPVELPKLCCGGSCGCGGACGCNGDCNGCCRDSERDGTHNNPQNDLTLVTVGPSTE